MKKLGYSSFLGILFIAAFVILCPLGTLFGWIGGWSVGWFFGDYITQGLSAFGLHGVSLAQLGAILGFISSFFRISTTKSSD